jgi:hypothetical protein
MGLEKMNPRTFIIVIAISLGVALASYGELNLFVPNFISTTAGIIFYLHSFAPRPVSWEDSFAKLLELRLKQLD